MENNTTESNQPDSNGSDVGNSKTGPDVELESDTVGPDGIIQDNHEKVSSTIDQKTGDVFYG